MKTKETQCPVCKAKLDGAFCIEGKEILPNEGDLSLCVYCQTILVFDADQTVREANPDDLASLTAIEQRLLKIMGETFTESAIEQ